MFQRLIKSVAVMAICMATAFAASPTDAKDKMFLQKAAGGGMAEVAFAKIALDKSQNQDVRNFAQKMIDDHTKLNDNLKPIADQLGVQPPAEAPKEAQAKAEKLKKLDGDAFDKAYIKAMVEDHHKDLAEFTKEEQSTKNDDLKAKVSDGRKTIEEHTAMIDDLAKKNGIPTPKAAAM